MYRIKKYPMKTFMMAKKGQIKGLKRKDATAVQSSVTAPTPRPLIPDPSCCAVTDLENTQHTHEMLTAAKTNLLPRLAGAQKAYKLPDIDTWRILVSRGVIFHENNLPFKTKAEVEPIAVSPSLPLTVYGLLPNLLVMKYH
ncbi:hypothetical protein V2J09_002588 [Rumex salicifolius]